MNALVPTLAEKLKKLPPTRAFTVGLVYVLTLAALARFAPVGMSFTLLYLLGVAFAAWSAGRWPATFLAFVSAAGICLAEHRSIPTFVPVWNGLSRFVILTTIGLVVAEMSRLTSRLHQLAHERSVRWQTEVQEHLATSARLTEALERFQQIADHTLEVFWLFEPSTNRFLYVSPGFERIWGRTCEELYSTPGCWQTALHPADRAQLLNRPLREKASSPYETQYRIVRPDGAVRWIRERAFPVRNEKGELQRIAGLAEDITAWKTAWETLSTQACILESMKEAVLMTDEQGLIVQTNAACETLLGYTRAELLGKTLQSCSAASPEKATQLLEAALEQARARGLTTGEHLARRKDGSMIWVATQGSSLTLGERQFLVVVGQDITARKHIEEALRLSQRQLAEAMDLARLANWEYHVASGKFTFDDRFFRLYGTTPAREGGNQMSAEAYAREFLLPEDAHLVTQGVAKALRTTDPHYATHVQHQIRRRDGEIRHILVRLAVTKDAAGQTTSIRGVNQDITEQKHAEEQLADALDLNQRILAASPMGIIAYKASGKCVFANPMLTELIGGTVTEHLDQDFRQLSSWRRDGLLELADKTLAQGKAQANEIHGLTSFGKEVWLDFHMAPFTRRNQPHLLCMIYDIADRRRLERQVLEISDREQARIGQDLHDGLCQKLVSMAFDANSLEHRLSAESNPQAAIAKRIADLLDQSITEARNLSRGLFPVRLEADGLSSAFQELARSTHQRFGVECSFISDEPVRIAERPVAVHLYRIAQEAVNNALKHAQAQSIEIELLSRAGQFELTITDDGIGFPPPHSGQPQGMGLHIMDYRARSLRGTLKVAPGPHGGTIVSCCVSCPSS